ncbi:MAG: LuxR C-terminal-related transcriptional regulator [Pseudomonadota bacterium]
METLRVLSEWNRSLSLAIKAVGSNEFFTQIIAAVQERVPIAYPQIWHFQKDLPPRVLYHEIPTYAVHSQIDAYVKGPYRDDPFYQTAVNRPRSRIYRLSRLTGGRLEETEYYRKYYASTGTIDEAVFVTPLSGEGVVNFSMMRLPNQGVFSETEYQVLYSLADPIAELIRTHTEYEDFAVKNLVQPGINQQIDLAFKTFGSSLLSPREKDVLELMLRGHGTDTSASRLSIARETVRRHRKNIYRKLDVSSQTDLFSLFINSMSCLGEAGGDDPLRIYMGLDS